MLLNRLSTHQRASRYSQSEKPVEGVNEMADKRSNAKVSESFPKDATQSPVEKAHDAAGVSIACSAEVAANGQSTSVRERRSFRALLEVCGVPNRNKITPSEQETGSLVQVESAVKPFGTDKLEINPRLDTGMRRMERVAGSPRRDSRWTQMSEKTATKRHTSQRRGEGGFSLIELVMVVAITMILAAAAVPSVRASVQFFRLRGAVSSVTSAIQSARYQAIFQGCPYNITLSNTANTYQVASEGSGGGACAASFTNVGSAVPFGVSAVTLSAATTLQFKPSGYVSATTGSTTFTLTYGSTTETITVSPY